MADITLGGCSSPLPCATRPRSPYVQDQRQATTILAKGLTPITNNTYSTTMKYPLLSPLKSVTVLIGENDEPTDRPQGKVACNKYLLANHALPCSSHFPNLKTVPVPEVYVTRKARGRAESTNPCHKLRLPPSVYELTKTWYSCCSRRATGPRTPLPTVRPSTTTTGITPAKVPVTNASSALYTCTRTQLHGRTPNK